MWISGNVITLTMYVIESFEDVAIQENNRKHGLDRPVFGLAHKHIPYVLLLILLDLTSPHDTTLAAEHPILQI